jgi:hypothetical protein
VKEGGHESHARRESPEKAGTKSACGKVSMAQNDKRDSSEAESVQPRREAFVNARPTHDQIKRRAHEIYLERGRGPGDELDDWLRAERELERIALYTRSWNRLSVLDGRQLLNFADYYDGKLELVNEG